MCSRKNTTSGTVSAIGDYYLVDNSLFNSHSRIPGFCMGQIRELKEKTKELSQFLGWDLF